MAVAGNRNISVTMTGDVTVSYTTAAAENASAPGQIHVSVWRESRHYEAAVWEHASADLEGGSW